jgi:hypothetical protein
VTQNELLEDFKKVLFQYTATLGVNSFQNSPEIDIILGSTEDDRQCWTEDELLHKAFSLHQYGAYLQRSLNKERTTQNWCKSNLRVLFGKEQSKYSGFAYAERQDQCLADNSAVKALFDIQIFAESRIHEIEHITGFVSSMAGVLTELAKTKRAFRYENRN